MNFLKNIALNLKATGLAAVAVVWVICMTILGIFGNSLLSWLTLFVLNCAGAFILYLLAKEVALEELKERIVIIDRAADRRINNEKVRDGAQNEQDGEDKR